MCTLALAWRVFPNAPVAMVANRDESLERPSAPPTVRSDAPTRNDASTRNDAPTRNDASTRNDAPTIVAPRDETAGGTWIGASDRGLVVAITNRWLDDTRAGERSRGLLVDDCLRREGAEAAVRFVERDLDDRSYGGFTLVLADDVAAFLLAYDGRLSVTRLDPGVHVVGNVGGVINGTERFDVPERRAERGASRVESARRIAAALAPEPSESSAVWLDRGTAVLADHEYGACLHGDGFGTRSCTRIRTGPEAEFGFADGPPCETSMEAIELPAAFATDGKRDEGREA